MMAQWHIKEISELTNISVRMLRHYDKIGLLEPSYRESNGYRCYTEPDLAKLQQIIALKYFGFSLIKIKEILQKHSNVYAHLQAQQQVLRKQRDDLLKVSHVLEEVLKVCSASMSPSWHDLVVLIEGYQMTENLRDKLKNSWAGQQLTVAQFEDYLFLYEQFPEEFALRDTLIEAINQQKVGNPEGPDGERVAVFMEDLAKKMKRFFTEHVKLGASLLESIQSGRITQLELTPEGTHWLSQAMMAYSLKRWDNLYNRITNHIDSPPEGKEGKKVAQEWRNLIDNFLAAGNKEYLIGIVLWQEVSRQNHEIKALKTSPPPQEMIKPWHIKIMFNPQASVWISKALEAHQ